MSRKQELDTAFKSSSSVGEKMEVFKLILSSSLFNQSDLVSYCWAIIDRLLRKSSVVPNKPQQVYSFGITAMTIYARKIPCFSFPSNRDALFSDTFAAPYKHAFPLFFAVVQFVLGVSCHGLMRFDESLCLLDWADDNLTELDNDEKNRCPRNCVRNLLASTHQLMCNIKVARGKLDEAVVHAGKALKFKELVMQEGSIELAREYVEACGAYVSAKNAKEALPVCLKAVEIYSNSRWVDPEEVAMLRVDLEVLYRVVGEYEKAAEQKRLWQAVLKNTDMKSGSLNGEIKVGNMLIHFGRCEEAIEVMRVLASRANTETGGRLTSFVNMARASCILGEIDDAKEHIKAAERIIENDIKDPIFVGITSMNISEIYEMMNDLESAISLVKRVFENSQHLQKNLEESLEKFNHLKLVSRSSTRLFSLISLAGREKQEIPYMVSMVEKLQQTFDFKNIDVGYACAKLGAALINTGPEDQAAKLIEDAKDIMDVALGPHHLDSLRTRHTLSEIYATLGRYNAAIEIQEKVIEGLKGLEQSEHQFIDKAVKLLNEVKERKLLNEMKEMKLLNEMKERVEESPTSAPSLSQDDKDVSAEKSECGPSGDGIRPK